ncbi:hypothetical protein RRG08_043798 [Elysia crispata]|uniref:Uncharacterized protein n=1 Tax=Elysia crispata TaxID=231223 RepID=A0AAE1D9W1_9GAST|nr:hypothetical protein RRG08_043798 [Elysia crispata]
MRQTGKETVGQRRRGISAHPEDGRAPSHPLIIPNSATRWSHTPLRLDSLMTKITYKDFSVQVLMNQSADLSLRFMVSWRRFDQSVLAFSFLIGPRRQLGSVAFTLGQWFKQLGAGA